MGRSIVTPSLTGCSVYGHKVKKKTVIQEAQKPSFSYLIQTRKPGPSQQYEPARGEHIRKLLYKKKLMKNSDKLDPSCWLSNNPPHNSGYRPPGNRFKNSPPHGHGKEESFAKQRRSGERAWSCHIPLPGSWPIRSRLGRWRRRAEACWWSLLFLWSYCRLKSHRCRQ